MESKLSYLVYPAVFFVLFQNANGLKPSGQSEDKNEEARQQGRLMPGIGYSNTRTTSNTQVKTHVTSFAEEEPLGPHNQCGCGGDKCEIYGRCKTPGMTATCCNNRCKCVLAKVELNAGTRVQICGVCTSSTRNSLTCKDALASEFNCMSKMTIEKELSDTDIVKITQYSYFK